MAKTPYERNKNAIKKYIAEKTDDIRAYLKTQKSCIIQTKAKWKQRVRKQETMKQAYHNEQQLCEKL